MRLRLLKVYAVTCILVLQGLVGAAWAQDAPAAATGKNYFLGYVLVALGIFLGLASVCRPGRRTTEVKVKE